MDEDEESDYASAEEADAPTITSTNQEPGTENEKVCMFCPWLKDLKRYKAIRFMFLEVCFKVCTLL